MQVKGLIDSGMAWTVGSDCDLNSGIVKKANIVTIHFVIGERAPVAERCSDDNDSVFSRFTGIGNAKHIDREMGNLSYTGPYGNPKVSGGENMGYHS